MDLVTNVYAAVMAIGVLWIIWRAVVYFRIQKRREFLWDELTYDEHFMNFLERLKAQKGEKAPVTAIEETAPDSQSSPELTKSDDEP
jgi:hypothetical protein